MAYNTNNPVGSTDPRDLYDNAGNLDNFVNGDAPFYPDRLGQQRKSWSGMEADFSSAQEGREAAFDQFLEASAFIWIGDYGAGLTFTSRSQYTVRDGYAYRLAESTTIPYTSTGNWALEQTKFSLVNSDDILRQELSDPNNQVLAWERNTLSASITSASQFLSAQIVNVWEFANLAIGYSPSTNPTTWDWTPAARAAIATRRKVYFPQGRYKITGKLVLSDPEQNATIRACASIIGDGSDKTIFSVSGMDETVIETGHTVTTSQNFSRVEGVTLQGFSIIGDGTNTENNHGFLPRSMFKCALRDVVVRGVGGHGMYAPRDPSLEIVSGFTGGSDIYGCQLSLSNVFFHGCGRSGIWSDIFSFVLFNEDVFVQDNGEWGAVISGPLLKWSGGSIQYNGKKPGLAYGQGGGIMSGAGNEGTPSAWDVKNLEIDRNMFNQVRIVRGVQLSFSRNRFLDSVDNVGEFFSVEQICCNGSYCSFSNNYFRLPSDSGKATIMFRWQASSVGNVVDTWYLNQGASSGVTVSSDSSTLTPGNLVKERPGRIVALNRPYPEKNLTIATINGNSAVGSTASVLPLSADSRIFLRPEAVLANTFAPGVAGVYKVSGQLALGGFALSAVSAIALHVRVNDSVNTLLFSEQRSVISGGATYVLFSGVVALESGDSITIRASSTVSASTVSGPGVGQVAFERL